MFKKIIIVLSILISPFISLVAFSPISMLPAIIIAKIVTKNQCEGIQGESLCGFGNAIFYGLILNVMLGFIGITTVMLITTDTWPAKKKLLNVVGLFIYFTVAAGLFFYLMDVSTLLR